MAREMSFVAGTSVGAYEILAPLGAGGMGEVYLARESRLGRQVALKILPPDLTGDPHRVARFELEARCASSLSHPNICVIHALGETPDGRRYIDMEYVDGTTLRDRLARGRVPAAEAVSLGIQIASGLAAAHASGIVHRDLKPENVMVRPDGLVKILDFGLAKLRGEGPSGESDVTLSLRQAPETNPGTVLGTIQYMSPEQARGLEVDARTDLWAVGAILYELVTGRRPFGGATGSDTLAAILERDPPPLSRIDNTIPAELQRIVTKSLRKDRDERYQTAKDLMIDLRALGDELRRGGQESTVTPIQTPAPAAPPAPSSAEYLVTTLGRHKLAVGATLTVVVAGLALGAWWLARISRPPVASVKQAVARNYTRLTFGPGLQTDVTFSPDGRFIAFASDRAGNFDIWVQPVAGGDPVQVTKSPAQDTEPDWSPDGSTIAFRSTRSGGGIYVVPALGGAERQVSSVGEHPRWSRDGKEILCFTGSVDAGLARIELYSVAPQGDAAPAKLLGDLLRHGFWLWASPHPDGRISLLGQTPTIGTGFFTVSRDGTRIVQSKGLEQLGLQVDATGLTPERFQWNSSGTALFLEATVKGVQNLWKVEVDPQTLEWRSAERLTTGPGHDGMAMLSRDGRQLAYTTWTVSSRLWSFAMDPTGTRFEGSGTPVTEDQAEVLGSDLAPDGKSLAFALHRSGDPRPSLSVENLDTGTTSLVPTGPDFVPSVVWSRDSTRIAYGMSRFDEEGWPVDPRLVVRNVSSGREDVYRAGKASLFAQYDWTPDGQSLLGFLYGRSLAPKLGGIVLWRILARIPAEHPDAPLAPGDIEFGSSCRVSPDGRWFACPSRPPGEPGGFGITVWPLSAGGVASQPRELVGADDHPEKPRWSADGRVLFFLSRRNSSLYNLWGVRFDPSAGARVGTPFQVSRFESPSLAISPWVLKTDMSVVGRRAIVTMQTTSGSIWMIDGADQ